MDFSEYFVPISREGWDVNFSENHLFASITTDWQEENVFEFDIALIGVLDDRNAHNNAGCSPAPNCIRKYLYRLISFGDSPKVVDLGNFKTGKTTNDTYFALASIIEQLIKKNVIPIIIGGGQDLTYSNFLAYKNLEQTVNIVAVDSKFNLGNADDSIDSSNFLSKIIMHQPNFLFNYSNIGYQSYFVAKEEVALMSKLYFDAYRLGWAQQNLQEVEPIVRNADLVSFDISAIRQSEAPANNNASPNGFYGEQACQIARYAGLSDKLTSIGFHELNPSFDREDQSSHLVAQMIWYFIDGVNNRKRDFPIGSRKNYLKYRVSIHKGQNEIIFYKSDKSERWWMEVPYPSHEKIRYERHLLVPCSYSDYKLACENEVPNRWLETFQKLT